MSAVARKKRSIYAIRLSSSWTLSESVGVNFKYWFSSAFFSSFSSSKLNRKELKWKLWATTVQWNTENWSKVCRKLGKNRKNRVLLPISAPSLVLTDTRNNPFVPGCSYFNVVCVCAMWQNWATCPFCSRYMRWSVTYFYWKFKAPVFFKRVPDGQLRSLVAW